MLAYATEESSVWLVLGLAIEPATPLKKLIKEVAYIVGNLSTFATLMPNPERRAASPVPHLILALNGHMIASDLWPFLALHAGPPPDCTCRPSLRLP